MAKDLIAVGRVSAVYPDSMTATVHREDIDVVTYNLSITTRGFEDDWLPEVGDYVLCIFLPKGSSNGYILCDA